MISNGIAIIIGNWSIDKEWPLYWDKIKGGIENDW